jgi:hypothetical protein
MNNLSQTATQRKHDPLDSTPDESRAKPQASLAATTAIELTDLGYFVTPLCWPTLDGQCGCHKKHTDPHEIGKAPLLGDGYEKKKLTRAQVKALVLQYPTANWGLLLKPSELLVSDADSAEADREVERRGAPPGPRHKTAKGFHRVFHNPSGIATNTIKRGDSQTLDILATGYVVLPGSRHRSGAIYESEVSFTEAELEEAPQWMIDLLRESQRAQVEVDALPNNLPPCDLVRLKIPAWVKEVIVKGQSAREKKYPSRSEAVFAVVTALLKAGYDTATIAGILLDPQYAISAKPREQGRKWLAGDIARARVRLQEEKERMNGHGGGTSREDGAEVNSCSTIQVNNRHLRDVLDEALKALVQRNSPPSLFCWSGGLGRIHYNEYNRPIIAPVVDASMRERLTRCADFIRTTKKTTKDNEEVWIQTKISPPREIAEILLALPQWPFPVLQGITECPVLRSDGTILHTPGYDPTTRLYFQPSTSLRDPAIPEHPTEIDARHARDFLFQELLPDFPFADKVDRANMVACLLTPIVRPAISGNVPLCLLDKPGPGSGATLLSDVAATIATGQHAAKQLAPEGKFGEDEWRKKLTAILLDGSPVVVFDNIEYTLASSALSAVLTTSLWKDRVLGKTSTITLPVRQTWIATANNISLRGDLARRCYRIRIDPKQERPWTRDGFRHPDLLGWVQENRGKLLSSLLVMARAWFAAGQPKAQTPKLGGFEKWVHFMGGILVYAGIEGFLGNQEEIYSMVDEDAQQWGAFFATWYEELGEQPITVAELAGSCETIPRIKEALPESLPYLPEDGAGFRKKLGNAMKKRRDRVYSEYKLEQAKPDSHAKVARWSVKSVAGSAGS